MEKEIKQRLLGGLILVAGAALFLPVLLDGSGASLTVPPLPAPPQVAGVDELAPKLDQKVEAASQAVAEAHAGRDDVPPEAVATAAPDQAEPGTAAQPVPPEPAAAAAVAERERLAAEKAALEKAAAEKAALEKAQQEKAAAAKAASKPAAAERKPAVVPPAAWVVQVASLSSRDKAGALVQKLRHKGYAAVVVPQGSLWKVMVGPELSREVADATRAKLAADPELKLNGWVQSYKP